MKNKIALGILIFVLGLTSCDENTYPRPKGDVRLEYPDAKYSLLESDSINFSFEKSNQAKTIYKNQDWVDLLYPKMKATLHLTNKKIDNNSDALLKDIQELTYKHTIKASGIIENPYHNENNNTDGMLYELTGDAASNIQFYIKDNKQNILSGALYFYAEPNSDSLAPAVAHIKKDVIMLMESISWKN